MLCVVLFFFFFQAEDGIRDIGVTEFRRVLFRSVEPDVAALPEVPSDLEVRVRPVDAREVEHVDAGRVVAGPTNRIPVFLERDAVSGWSQSARVPPDPGHGHDAPREEIEDFDVDERVRLNREDRDRHWAFLRRRLGFPNPFLLAFELGTTRLRVEENREAFVAARMADVRATVAVDARDRAHHEQLRVHLAAAAPRAGGEIRRTETPRHRTRLTRRG